VKLKGSTGLQDTSRYIFYLALSSNFFFFFFFFRAQEIAELYESE
jgi:hypothetical protein